MDAFIWMIQLSVGGCGGGVCGGGPKALAAYGEETDGAMYYLDIGEIPNPTI